MIEKQRRQNSSVGKMICRYIVAHENRHAETASYTLRTSSFIMESQSPALGSGQSDDKLSVATVR